MARHPAALRRPVVILGGYHAPPNVAGWVRTTIYPLTSDKPEDFLCVSFPLATGIDDAAQRAARRIDARWRRAPELDAIGLSMGGLVARLAAAEHGVRLARLYSFATPHNGAKRAARVSPDRAARDMKPGSPFLARLNEADRPYELVCYGQAGDRVVDAAGWAPPGVPAFVAPGSRILAHFTTPHNPWFVADLARRLRGEEPLLTSHRPCR